MNMPEAEESNKHNLIMKLSFPEFFLNCDKNKQLFSRALK